MTKIYLILKIKKRKRADTLIKLVSRNAEDQRDGYVELVGTRQSFNNVSRRLVSRGNQANPPTSDNEVQTTTKTPVDSWFQYSYDYTPINTTDFNKDLEQAARKFLDRYREFTCEQVNPFIFKPSPLTLLISTGILECLLGSARRRLQEFSGG